MTAKQMRALLQSISTDPQLKQSKDSILLAEDQYPEHLDTIFNKLSVPTTLQNTIILLQWNRNLCDSSYDAALKSTSITNQDYLQQTISWYRLQTTHATWIHFEDGSILSLIYAYQQSKTQWRREIMARAWNTFFSQTLTMKLRLDVTIRKVTFKGFYYTIQYYWTHHGKHQTTWTLRSEFCCQQQNPS